ncbi:MAG: hypothetical protein WD176_00595, partial [Pirellulales bacterium]
MSEAAAPNYAFTPECRALIAALDIAESQVIEAYERRSDGMIVPSIPGQVYIIRWHEDGRALFVSARFGRMEWHIDRARPAEIVFTMALWLRRQLPAGSISPQMEMDRIWVRVAESFGTPVTCHKDFPAHRRYTGRWDGQAPRCDSTGEDGDEILVDGALEQSGTNAKYVWALSRKIYEKWLAESAGPTEQAEPTRDPARIVFARMSPAKLKRPIAVRADIGEAAVRLVCTRCSLTLIDDPPFFHPPLACLHVFGAEVIDAEKPPGQLTGKEYIIPLDFITDIRSGPPVFIAGESMPQRSA